MTSTYAHDGKNDRNKIHRYREENANNIKSYQWYRISRIADDEKMKIEGATTAEYTLEEDDLGYILICVVTDQDNNEFCSEEIYTFEPYFEPSLQ